MSDPLKPGNAVRFGRYVGRVRRVRPGGTTLKIRNGVDCSELYAATR